jgi:hypothetical protein
MATLELVPEVTKHRPLTGYVIVRKYVPRRALLLSRTFQEGEEIYLQDLVRSDFRLRSQLMNVLGYSWKARTRVCGSLSTWK